MKKGSFQFVALLLVIGLSACGGRHHDNQVKTAAPAPVLSFSPSSGAIGTLITLSGTDYSAATSVSINGVSAILVNKSTSALTAMVMPGASTTGSVSYTTATGTTSVPGTFTVMATGIPAAQQDIKQLASNATSDGTNGIWEGYSVAVSADGNTAVVGGPYNYDTNTTANTGAAWVYVRSGVTWAQQGTMLVDPASIGAHQGWSVAVSADGNTAVVGGPYDSAQTGAAWVWTRSGTTWTQQSKLVATTDPAGPARQGTSVAVSADGNTVVVGGSQDNSGVGAAWVWTRSGTTWTPAPQGKLVGTGYDATGGGPNQGQSVAISADGSTIVVGGPWDYDSIAGTYPGAAWVWTLNTGTWTQQGSKLLGNDSNAAGGYVFQGQSVAASADGNTVVVGGPYDYDSNTSAFTGAAWVYVHSGSSWVQQGNKLVDTIASSAGALQGASVAVSADGTTAMVGGNQDSSGKGAAWTFTLTNGSWVKGSKLVGNSTTTSAYQGFAVALSADGNTAVVGGYQDSSYTGAAWIFIP